MPVPDPNRCDLERLALAFDRLADSELQPFPKIENDQIRHAIDVAVIESIPGLSTRELKHLRRSIALEPSVTNKKEPVSLNR